MLEMIWNYAKRFDFNAKNLIHQLTYGYLRAEPAVLVASSASGGSYTLVWSTDGALLALFTPTGHGFCSCERPPTAAAAAGPNASSPSLFSVHERARARFVANAGGCALYRADGSLAQRVRWAPPPQRLPGTILLPVWDTHTNAPFNARIIWPKAWPKA